ncbi:Serine carboxypeptidase-like 25 isoform 1 [Hibiscus syriacus]|uniref:Exocyst subunit Exo70 family protein n=1 Tax=Hibiscus syriacus TaxID=106335 RepID=A0A6A2ZV16_HIBSY|nr:Serine carboxypeptidase-like 25 isoform 1 [Hibiscus syriacus]
MGDCKSMAPPLEGEENLIAAAEHIVKALGSNKYFTKDVKKILADLGSQLSSMATMEDNMVEGKKSGIVEQLSVVEEKIMSLEADDFVIWDSGPDEVVQFVTAVDEALKLTRRLESLCLNSQEEKDWLCRAHDVLQMAMQRLEDEFKHMLVQHRQPFEPELCIANLMFRSNYFHECCQAYVLVRKDALDECLLNLEIEKLSIEDVLKMEWGTLNSKIKRWVRAMKVFIRPYLASEKWLCDQTFAELGSANSDESNSSSGSISRTLLRERLRSFYAAFDDVYKTQTAWLITDAQLREDLQISTSLIVVQAYRTFVGRQMHHIGEKHVRYNAEELEDYLLDFFEGSQKSLHNPHRR